MSEVLSVTQLRKMASTIIEIPGFDGASTIKVRVRKPQILSMAGAGKIPNHLLSVAVAMVSGEQPKDVDKMKDIDKIKMINDTMDLYCTACLVEPKYESIKDILTDEQKDAIFDWGIGQVSSLDSFRENHPDGSHDNDGEEVSEKA